MLNLQIYLKGFHLPKRIAKVHSSTAVAVQLHNRPCLHWALGKFLTNHFRFRSDEGGCDEMQSALDVEQDFEGLITRDLAFVKREKDMNDLALSLGQSSYVVESPKAKGLVRSGPDVFRSEARDPAQVLCEIVGLVIRAEAVAQSSHSMSRCKVRDSTAGAWA